jgi:transketolase
VKNQPDICSLSLEKLVADLETINRLRRTAAKIRLLAVKMMGAGKVHHFGGSLSAADLITALYFYRMRFDPRNLKWPERDRLIMSKGHSVPIQYAALAILGVFEVDELLTLKRLGSRLQGHPAMHLTPGLEGCTGALGEGLSYANGMALAARVKGLSYRVFCLTGDGELHEGQIWEAAMTAPRKGLANVTVLIDRNRLKAMDAADSCKSIDPLALRWESFGWAVREIDGHNMREICDALDWACGQESRPSAIICNTVKGKGVSFLEGAAGFHNAPISDEQYAVAVQELEADLRQLEGVDATAY